MQTLLYPFVIIFIGKTSFDEECAPHQDLDIVSYMEINNMGLCPNCSEECDKNYKAEFKVRSQWKRNHYAQYFSGKMYVDEIFEIKRSHTIMYKCRNFQQSVHECERFISFYQDAAIICFAFKMKNQWWSPVLDAVQPQTFRRTCPVVNEEVLLGIVHLNNASVDTEVYVKLYPHAVNHFWKFHNMFVENARNKKLLCMAGDACFKRYTYRRRKNG